jgi:integrase
MRSCGTTDARTARAIQAMLDALGPTGARAWELLARVTGGEVTLIALFDRYQECGRDVAKLRASLDDVDLVPYIQTWANALHSPARGLARDSALHYISATRDLIPSHRPLLRSQFTAAYCSAWVSQMQCSPGTIRKRVVGARDFANWLVSSGVLSASPLSSIQLPPPGRPRTRWLTTAQLLQLASTKTPAYRDLDLVLGATAMDLSTALSVIRADVDLDAMSIRARGTKSHTRDRVVLVASFAHEALQARCESLHQNLRVFHDIPDRWTAADAHRRAVAELVAAGETWIDGYWLRDHRHSWAVRMARVGTPFRIIAEGLGHANEVLVARIYARYQPTAEERQKWERLAAVSDA